MTTQPVPSITDEQIAEIEAAAIAKKNEGFILVHNLSCNYLLALISRLRAAEKDAGRYKKLSVVTPYRFKKMQDACTVDGGDVFYLKRDQFDGLVDAVTGEKP